MNFKDTLPGVFLCVAMFACGHARANMLVYPMAAEINSSREEATSLFVYSKSDHVQYIRTRIMRIEHPGMPQEKEVPAGNDIETGLVVSRRNLPFPREQKNNTCYHYSGTGKRGSLAGILRGCS